MRVPVVVVVVVAVVVAVVMPMMVVVTVAVTVRVTVRVTVVVMACASECSCVQLTHCEHAVQIHSQAERAHDQQLQDVTHHRRLDDALNGLKDDEDTD